MSRLGYIRGTHIPKQHTSTSGSWRIGRIIALLAALLALLLFAWSRLAASPSTLSGYKLTGARGPACQRVIIANDVSGSMSQYSAPRRHALEQLLAWAGTNLRADDQVGVIDFAGTAKWSLSPITATGHPTPSAIPPNTLGDNTNIQPVIAAVNTLPHTRCDTHLWLLSDAQYSDYTPSQAAARTQLAKADIHSVNLLVPSKNISVDPAWARTYPYSDRKIFDGTDADQTALTYGKLLADITQQQLTQTD